MGWWENFWRGAPAAPVNVIKGREYPAVDDPRWKWVTDGAAIDELCVKRLNLVYSTHHAVACEGVTMAVGLDAEAYVNEVLAHMAGRGQRRAEKAVDRITQAGKEKK